MSLFFFLLAGLILVACDPGIRAALLEESANKNEGRRIINARADPSGEVDVAVRTLGGAALLP